MKVFTTSLLPLSTAGLKSLSVFRPVDELQAAVRSPSHAKRTSANQSSSSQLTARLHGQRLPLLTSHLHAMALTCIGQLFVRRTKVGRRSRLRSDWD